MKKPSLHVNAIPYRAVTKSVSKVKLVRTNKALRLVFLIFLTLCFTSVFAACSKSEKAVLEAYQLRIDGKVNEAKTRLEVILKADSTNAMAHFELARTLNYINLRGSELADKHLGKALILDPDNVVYNSYKARNCFLKAYIALQTGGDNAKEVVEEACVQYQKVLDLKPDYAEMVMSLVEIYGMLPEDLGGNKDKAEQYAGLLQEMDQFYAAKARLVMMPEGTDMTSYWESYIEVNGECCKSLKELGVACIYKDDINEAKKHFEKAMVLDVAQNIRLLDLARYHQMKVMQNREAAVEELPIAKEYIQQYLQSTPRPIPPMQAYAMGMLAKSEMFLGNREEGQKIMQKAKTLDPYFSRAFGIPTPSIFEAPNKINHHFASFFSPY